MRRRLLTCQALDVNPDDFLEFWASRYQDDLEPLYEANIGKALTKEAILELFVWKNGGTLSGRKRESVEQNYILRRDEDGIKRAARLPQEASLDQSKEIASNFLEGFKEGGAIWRIFWLHCCNQRFPIYDQHVHRAMLFIEGGPAEELGPLPDYTKIAKYLEKYLSFHRQFSGRSRQVDKALYTFGRFLKAWPHLLQRSS